MSNIDDILNKNPKEKSSLLSSLEPYLLKESFYFSDYTGWNYKGEKNGYNVWIDVEEGYFTLYIYKGEYQGESSLEETVYFFSEEEFKEKYKEILKKIRAFFN